MPIELFAWTTHAEERANERGLSRGQVERAIRDGNPMRANNPGAADWRLDLGRFVVLYDHPYRGDIDAACIVSVWGRRRRRKLVSDYPG